MRDYISLPLQMMVQYTSSTLFSMHQSQHSSKRVATFEWVMKIAMWCVLHLRVKPSILFRVILSFANTTTDQPKLHGDYFYDYGMFGTYRLNLWTKHLVAWMSNRHLTDYTTCHEVRRLTFQAKHFFALSKHLTFEYRSGKRPFSLSFSSSYFKFITI